MPKKRIRAKKNADSEDEPSIFWPALGLAVVMVVLVFAFRQMGIV